LKIRSAQDIVTVSPTFSGPQPDGTYSITKTSFKNIEINEAGTDDIFLSSKISGDASLSSISVSDSVKSNFLNYSLRLKFAITLAKETLAGNFSNNLIFPLP
jgi:hypothetical protein